MLPQLSVGISMEIRCMKHGMQCKEAWYDPTCGLREHLTYHNSVTVQGAACILVLHPHTCRGYKQTDPEKHHCGSMATAVSYV